MRHCFIASANSPHLFAALIEYQQVPAQASKPLADVDVSISMLGLQETVVVSVPKYQEVAAIFIDSTAYHMHSCSEGFTLRLMQLS